MCEIKKLEAEYDEALAEEQGTLMLMQDPTKLDQEQFNGLLRKYGVALTRKFKAKKLLVEARKAE